MTVEKTRRHSTRRPTERPRERDDRGEGVISAAIAVHP